jgi:hypothetical protein
MAAFLIQEEGMSAQTAFSELTAEETAYLEACLARRREMIALARRSGNGHVLATCEEAAVGMAQTTACELLAAGIDTAIAEVEKKGGRRGRARAAHGAGIVGRINARS